MKARERHTIWSRLRNNAPLIGILLIAVALRFVNQPDNPGWYTDETTHIEIARWLLNGQTRYFAVQDSVLLFGRPPLFSALLASVMQVTGWDGIVALRALTGALGALTVLLLYVTARRYAPDDLPLAVLSALALAIMPLAVVYSRIGYSYALLSPLVVLALLGMAEYLSSGARRWLALASLAIGIGLTSDLMIGALIPALALVSISRRRWRDLFGSVALAALPFAAWATGQLLAQPDIFLFDLRYTLGRLSSPSLAGQAANIARSVTVLLSSEGWLLAGVMGLLLLPPGGLRTAALLCLALPMLLIGRVVALYSLSFYYITPLLPLIALGVGTLARVGFIHLADLPRGWPVAGRRVFALLVIGLVPLTSLALTWEQVQTRLPTAIDPFLVAPANARTVADYLNRHVEIGATVIVSPMIGWLLRDELRVADYQMSIAAEGVAGPHLPANIPLERFAFDPGFDAARFVVVDATWRRWGVVHVPRLAERLGEVEAGWRLAFAAGEGADAIRVYLRP